MQKYIKQFTVKLAWIAFSPIILLGFVLVTVAGTFRVGVQLAEIFWDKAQEWVNE